jgi:LacI family transcriptional regulator
MAATLDDIARRVGVTSVTVSNVLRNRGRCSARTRQQILDVVAELGYRPNAAAKAMFTRRFNAVGLVLGMNEATSVLHGLLLGGIDTALAKRESHLTLIRLPDQKLASEGYVPKLLREFAVDGLLINYNAQIPPQMIELIERHRIPSVWINSKQSHDSVYPDDFGAAQEATRQLIAQGHGHIAYVDYATNWEEGVWHYSSVDRRDGYLKAMIAAGLQPRLINEHCPQGSQRIEHARQWLNGPDRPDAILAYSRNELTPIVHVALAAGLRLPEEMAIATFGAVPWAELGVTVSMMMIPQEQIGETAVQMLMNKIDTPKLEQPSVALPMQWRDG